MSSKALMRWRSGRRARIGQLLAAHQVVRGRASLTRQLDWALTLRLAAEFQGFARDLYGEAARYVAGVLAPDQVSVRKMILKSFLMKSALDRGNVHAGSLGEDFDRLGFTFWEAMDVADLEVAEWRRDLEALNRARNAIAHAVDSRLVVLAADGYPVVLRTVRRWQASLNGTAERMDHVVGEELAELLGAPPPWE